MRFVQAGSNSSLWLPFYIIVSLLSTLLFASTTVKHQHPLKASMSGSGPLNVFKQPLALLSRSPMTGFYRDGYCRTGAADMGNHAVGATVSEEFLDFTASQGNDLRVAGLSGGCKWCLCTTRWFEAFSAYKDGRIGKEAVPKVHLDATEDSALRKVDLEVFKEFAAKTEANGVH